MGTSRTSEKDARAVSFREFLRCNDVPYVRRKAGHRRKIRTARALDLISTRPRFTNEP
jgi:hypothetical protein